MTNEWYYKLFGDEFGPVTFEVLEELARSGTIANADEVKLGADGKWRRIGSIGRLAAVLPYEASVPRTIPTKAPSKIRRVELQRPVNAPLVTPARGTSEPQAPAPANNDRFVVRDEDLDLLRAKVAFEATERAAWQLLAWADRPNCNPQWWGVMNGTQEGPVDMKRLLEWAATGRLRPTDYVRNGIFGQFAPAANLPDLFTAARLVQQATESLQQAVSRAMDAKEAQTTAGCDAAVGLLASIEAMSAVAPVTPYSMLQPSTPGNTLATVLM